MEFVVAGIRRYSNSNQIIGAYFTSILWLHSCEQFTKRSNWTAPNKRTNSVRHCSSHIYASIEREFKEDKKKTTVQHHIYSVFTLLLCSKGENIFFWPNETIYSFCCLACSRIWEDCESALAVCLANRGKQVSSKHSPQFSTSINCGRQAKFVLLFCCCCRGSSAVAKSICSSVTANATA